MADLDFWLQAFGVVVTVIGALWAVFVHFDKRAENRKAPKLRATSGGGTDGGAISQSSAVFITQLPLGATLVLLAGIALLGMAFLNVGDRVSACIGIAAGGDLVGTTQVVNVENAGDALADCD